MTSVPGRDEEPPTPPEWKAWEEGTGRCPYCVDRCACSWWAICDCFMAPKPDQYPCAEDGCWGLVDRKRVSVAESPDVR